MYFYKYQKMNTLSISMLRHGEIFFASPKELNDIHECKPQYTFNATTEIWGKFIESILIETCIKLDLQPNSELAKEILALQKNILSLIMNGRKSRCLDYQNLRDKLFGIFNFLAITKLPFEDVNNVITCFDSYLTEDLDDVLNGHYYMSSFSKSATNLTMWGHYGDAERGFTVVYESTDGKVRLDTDLTIFPSFVYNEDSSVTIGQSTNTTTNLKEVIYKIKPVRANGFINLINKFYYNAQEKQYDYPIELASTLKKYNEENVGWVKYTDWKYEKELRLHLPVYDTLPPALRSIRMHNQHIKGIIFGSRTSEGAKKDILASCYYLKKSRTETTEIYVFQATPIRNQYKINVTTLGRVSDSIGQGLPYITKFTKETANLKQEACKIADAINAS